MLHPDQLPDAQIPDAATKSIIRRLRKEVINAKTSSWSVRRTDEWQLRYYRLGRHAHLLMGQWLNSRWPDFETYLLMEAGLGDGAAGLAAKAGAIYEDYPQEFLWTRVGMNRLTAILAHPPCERIALLMQAGVSAVDALGMVGQR